jgi:hypothetical protein
MLGAERKRGGFQLPPLSKRQPRNYFEFLPLPIVSPAPSVQPRPKALL